MSPIPKIVIETPVAKRKGVCEFVSLEEIEALRADLDEAKAMWRRALGEDRRDPAVTAKIAGLGEQVRALSEPAPEPAPEPASVPGPEAEAEPAPGTQEYADKYASRTVQRGLLAGPARTAELVPLDESLPWAASPREWCGWSGPDGEHCLLAPHGPREMHAAPIGAGSMRRWAALRSVTA